MRFLFIVCYCFVLVINFSRMWVMSTRNILRLSIPMVLVLVPPALSDGLAVEDEKKVRECVDQMREASLYSCVSEIQNNCTLKSKQVACNYNVALASYEYYLSLVSHDSNRKSRFEQMSKLAVERCNEVVDLLLEKDAQAFPRKVPHSQCVLSARISVILIDNPLLVYQE